MKDNVGQHVLTFKSTQFGEMILFAAVGNIVIVVLMGSNTLCLLPGKKVSLNQFTKC